MESGVPVHRFYRGKKADAETWLQDQTGSGVDANYFKKKLFYEEK